MNVDLRVLEQYGRTAVHCTSEEQAKMFVDAMWKQYPDRMKPAWKMGQTNWNKDRELRKSIFYLPRIVRESGEVRYCQSSNLSTSERNEYKIIEFSDLLLGFDFGEIAAPDIDIKSLFGMG